MSPVTVTTAVVIRVDSEVLNCSALSGATKTTSRTASYGKQTRGTGVTSSRTRRRTSLTVTGTRSPPP